MRLINTLEISTQKESRFWASLKRWRMSSGKGSRSRNPSRKDRILMTAIKRGDMSSFKNYLKKVKGHLLKEVQTINTRTLIWSWVEPSIVRLEVSLSKIKGMISRTLSSKLASLAGRNMSLWKTNLSLEWLQ